MKKKIFILIVLLIIILILLIKNYRFIADSIPESIKKNIPLSIVDIHHIIENNINLFSNKNYLYNVKFLPDTILVNKKGRIELELKELTIENDDFKNKFFVDTYKEFVFFATSNSLIYYIQNKALDQEDNSIKLQKINSNLNDYVNIKTIDSYVSEDFIYISAFEKKSKTENCDFKVLRAKINFEKLIFKELFLDQGCTSDPILGGKIQSYIYEGKKGILFSTAQQKSDKIHFKSQDDNSFVGKIIFLDLKERNPIIFSKGHRVAQGLYVENKTILSTEHGPMGADEVNKIIKGGNYGWPIASYGKKYFERDGGYLNNHEINNFVEPIYVYFTAIGISEIVKIPEKFFEIPDLNNIFFISSLAGKSLHLVKFDKNYNRVIFSEKIFINKEIRDLKYLDKENIFLLALQAPAKIGLFKIKD